MAGSGEVARTARGETRPHRRTTGSVYERQTQEAAMHRHLTMIRPSLALRLPRVHADLSAAR
jgi:hypothetical protein